MIQKRSAFFDGHMVIKFRSGDEQRLLLEREKTLLDEVQVRQRQLGAILGNAELFVVWCAVCLVSQWHPCHKVKETDEGITFRALHCGKRGVKLANLR